MALLFGWQGDGGKGAPLNNASVNDHLVPWDVDMAFDKKDNGVHTQWLNVTKDEEYYVEFLLRFDAGWRSKWNRGGFKALSSSRIT